MSFDNVIFPDYPMKHGIEKTIIDPVTIASNGTFEYRSKRQVSERFMWSIPTQSMTNEQKETIREFLLQRSHSLNSFLFVDPDMRSLTNVRLTYSGNIDHWMYNLPSGAGVAGVHPIYNAVDTTITLTLNGGVAYNRTHQIQNGIPVVNAGAFNSSDDVRVVSEDLHFTVRLNSTLSYALLALDTTNSTLGVNHAAIDLIEVFGEY